MVKYLELVEDVLTHGKLKKGSQAVSALTVYGRQIHYNLGEGFPLITTRDMSGSWRALVGELLWIMSGSDKAGDLHKHGVHLWDQWATPQTSGKLGLPDGELGPIYGPQLRNFGGKVDQLTQVIGMLQRNPNTRRAMISLWNLGDVEIDGVEKVFIAPCVAMLHFTHQDGELGLHVFQRSVDVPIGVPFDVAEYALFLMLVAKEVGLKPSTLVHTMSDTHIYEDQVPAMKELLKRKPRSRPTITITDSPSGGLLDHRVEDFQLHGYDPHPRIKIPVAT